MESTPNSSLTLLRQLVFDEPNYFEFSQTQFQNLTHYTRHGYWNCDLHDADDGCGGSKGKQDHSCYFTPVICTCIGLISEFVKH